ncbi:MAG: hypothetical protein JWO36_7221, partial [Myxococcales bacterium]|nr:hypothetical protein [Myxococcales bacterium]
GGGGGGGGGGRQRIEPEHAASTGQITTAATSRPAKTSTRAPAGRPTQTATAKKPNAEKPAAKKPAAKKSAAKKPTRSPIKAKSKAKPRKR